MAIILVYIFILKGYIKGKICVFPVVLITTEFTGNKKLFLFDQQWKGQKQKKKKNGIYLTKNCWKICHFSAFFSPFNKFLFSLFFFFCFICSFFFLHTCFVYTIITTKKNKALNKNYV